jgi:hypothetical protein
MMDDTCRCRKSHPGWRRFIDRVISCCWVTTGVTTVFVEGLKPADFLGFHELRMGSRPSCLAVGGEVTYATGTAEREAALALIARPRRRRSGRAIRRAGRITLGADKGYDVSAFVEALREHEVTPHIVIDGHVRKSGKPRKTAIDGRTTRHVGYAISQVTRKRIEEIYGWGKTTGGLAQVKLRDLAKVKALFTFALAAYNLIHIPKLLKAPA